MTLLIKEILKLKPKNQLVTAEGWVKNFRANKFISLNDGSTVRNIQCVIDFENFDESIIKTLDSKYAQLKNDYKELEERKARQLSKALAAARTNCR